MDLTDLSHTALWGHNNTANILEYRTLYHHAVVKTTTHTGNNTKCTSVTNHNTSLQYTQVHNTHEYTYNTQYT